MILVGCLAGLTLVISCDLVVRYSNLQVDASAVSEGDGSECFPFKSLAAAISTAQSQPQATISVQRSLTCASLKDATVITTAISIQAHGNCLQLQQPLTVAAAGNLTLRQASFSQAETVIIAKGNFRLRETIVEHDTWTIYAEGGSVLLEESRFIGLTSALVIVTGSSSEVDIADCEISGGSGIVVFYMEGSSSAKVSIANTAVSSGALATGTLRETEMAVNNSTLADLNYVVQGAIFDSLLDFENCTITNIANPPIALDYLKGSITISTSTIHSIPQGPIVLLPTNFYSPEVALVRIDLCRVWNVTNLDVRQSAAVVCVASATAMLTNSEIWNITVTKSGLLRLAGGVAQLANVYYHDSSVGIQSVFEVAMGFISAENLTVLRVENNDESSMILLTSAVGQLVNVSVVDSIDKHKQLYEDRIVMVAWFGSSAVVQRSYFRNPGDGFICMAAIVATVTITDSIFDNNQLVNAFATSEGGQFIMRNVTFRDFSSMCLVLCSLADFCANISDIHFEGRTQLTVLFYMFKGAAILADSAFQGTSFNVAKMNYGQLEVRRTSFQHCELSFCETCIAATLTLRDVVATHITTYIFFDLTLSQAQIVSFSVAEIDAFCLFQLDATNITLSGFRARETHVSALGGVLNAGESSSVAIESSALEAIRGTISFASGLIYVRQSVLVVSNSSATQFNTTLIYSVESRLDIGSSQFTSTGLFDRANAYSALRGGVLRDESALSVSIYDSLFANISANAGGALHFSSPTRSNIVYDLKNLTIRNCLATDSGGGIYGVQVSLRITDSVFEGNSASRGAGVWASRASLSLSNSRFSYNSAVLDGGGFQYIDTSLWHKGLSFNNNSAVYGPDIASQIHRIFVVSTENKPLPNYSTAAASGQWMNHSILLGLFDVDNQLIASDNSSQLTLKTANNSNTLEGTVLLYPQSGVYHADHLFVTGEELSTVRIQGSLVSLSDNVFTVSLRSCEVGEARNKSRCIPCTNNMYSLDPAIPCALCIPHATCAGGYKLTLSRGYWRSSTLTDQIYKCLAERLCLGGFDMECAEGHRGVMCNECADGYSKGSQLQCFRCRNAWVAGIKAVLSLSIAIASVLYASLHGHEANTVLFAVFDFFSLMRIFANLNVYWPGAVGYLLVVLGDIGSMGMTAFADSCLGSVASVAPVYSQTVISVVYFFSLVTALGLLSISVRKFAARSSELSVASVVMTAGVCMLPLLYTRAVQLFSCYEIDGVYRLVIDPSEKCWTLQHKKFALGLGLPIITCCLVLGVSLFALSIKYFKLHCAFQPMQSLLVSAILMRSFAASSYLVLSNSLVLNTQAGVSLILNLAADIHLLDPEQRSLAASTVYDLTLFSSTLFVFICLLYESVEGSHSESESAGYSAALYVALLLPLLLYGVAAVRKGLKKKKVIPITEAVGVAAESDGSFLRVPNQSFASIMPKDESVAPD